MSVFAPGVHRPHAARGMRWLFAAAALVAIVPGASSESTAPAAGARLIGVSGESSSRPLPVANAAGVANAAKVPPTPREPASPVPLARGTLGRLFFAPQERAAIDGGQVAPVAAAGRGSASVTETAAPTAPAATRIDGIMRRPNAPPVVWVDGEAVESDGTVAGRDTGARSVALARDGDSVTVRRPDGAAIALRPGQSSDSPELGEGNRFEVLR